MSKRVESNILRLSKEWRFRNPSIKSQIRNFIQEDKIDRFVKSVESYYGIIFEDELSFDITFKQLAKEATSLIQRKINVLLAEIS